MITRRAAFAGLIPLIPVCAQQARPNILLLHTDDQRWNTIRSWGNREIQTPNLDKLVARGTSFRQAYNQGGHVGAVCIASRAMLMSGKSLFRATAKNGLDDPLLPEFFRQAGYDAYFTGKWHIGAPALYRAFKDGGLVHLGGMGPHIDPELFSWGATQKAKLIGRASVLFANECNRFLQSRKSQSNPFFAYCSFTAPHDPRQAAELADKLYGGKQLTLPRPWFAKPPVDNGELLIRDELVVPAPRTRAQCQKELKDYYALITEIDEQIGLLMRTLEDQSQLNNTIVMFCADNGLAMGAHGLMGKQSMYEHSLRVPWILAGPGVPQRTESNPIHLYEAFNRLTKLAGLTPPPYAESTGPQYFGYRHFQRAIRLGHQKMMWAKHDNGITKEQYDLAEDPHEEKNLYGTSQQLPEAMLQGAALSAAKHYADPHPFPI